MDVALLYFDGCPSWETGLEKLKEALASEGIASEITLIAVRDDEEAERLQFLGSPSFRLNGKELWPESRGQYALSCRVYHTAQGLRGTPTVEELREKIRAGAVERSD